MMPRVGAQATPAQQADTGEVGQARPVPGRQFFDATTVTPARRPGTVPASPSAPAGPSAPASATSPASATRAGAPARPIGPANAASAASAVGAAPSIAGSASRIGQTVRGGAATADPPASGQVPRSVGARERAYVTARGAVVGMSALFFACNLIDGWTGLAVLAGLGYVAGCVLAPYFVRQYALPLVVAAPPAIFLSGLIVAQVLTAQGSGRHGQALSVLEGTLLSLAALAPWLLAGTALGVCVAIPRGLVRCVREVLTERREDIEERRPWAPRTR
jgi:hypothetical protein